MKERPILMSAPMVLAILSGTKTQTRRIVKPQPEDVFVRTQCSYATLLRNCPYGQAGDRLWCREAHKVSVQGRVIYRADSPFTKADEADRAFGPWKPSIFMRREYSRLTLEIVSVRIERVQEITDSDALAEGVDAKFWHPAYSAGYMALWETINGLGSWGLNPFVWVITFKRV